MKKESERSKLRINAEKYWVEWFVDETEDGESIECHGYKVVNHLQQSTGDNLCSMPLIWLQELILKYGALHVLRTPNHRPKDPYELVDFIHELEELS